MIKFELEPIRMGRILSVCPPKKRPRFWHKNGHSGVYKEGNYVSAQKQVLAQLKKLKITPFPVPCSIDVHFYGDLVADGDNAIGFLYDCFVLGGYLPDDKPEFVVKGNFEWHPVLIPTKRKGQQFKKTTSQGDKLAYWGISITITPYKPVAVIREPKPNR